MRTRETDSQPEFEKRIALLDALMRLGSLIPKRPPMGRVPPSRPARPGVKRYCLVRGVLVALPAVAAPAAA